MCIAIFKPEKALICKDVLRDCSIWHSDGAGFMAHDKENNRLIVKKGFFNFDEFWEAFNEYRLHKTVIHFRMATHGRTDAENCHPFLINKNIGFVHNGVIRRVKEYNKDMSDTWHFNETILKQLYKGLTKKSLFNPQVRFLIESFIGQSKLVIMDNYGKINIFNEKLGEWDSGCWFSNETYKWVPEESAKYLNYSPKELGSIEDLNNKDILDEVNKLVAQLENNGTSCCD